MNGDKASKEKLKSVIVSVVRLWSSQEMHNIKNILK